MKTVFKVAKFSKSGVLTLLTPEFDTYEEAEGYMKNSCGVGMFQVQKVFVISYAESL